MCDFARPSCILLYSKKGKIQCIAENNVKFSLVLNSIHILLYISRFQGYITPAPDWQMTSVNCIFLSSMLNDKRKVINSYMFYRCICKVQFSKKVALPKCRYNAAHFYVLKISFFTFSHKKEKICRKKVMIQNVLIQRSKDSYFFLYESKDTCFFA